MSSRSINVTVIVLCMTFSHQLVWADNTEAKLKQLEARLIYEAASQLVVDEEYDKAIRRFDRIIFEYPETEYARLARSKRSEITASRLQPKPISGISRASLVGFATLFTTWLGVGTLMLAEVDDPEPYGIALIAMPLGGLGGSMAITRGMKLSDGQASLINLGGVWGIWQATGAATIADLSEKGVVGASMAGGVIGLALSGSIARGRSITPGDATMINFGGIWGTWFALCGAIAADVEDDDGLLAYSMIGGDMGLLTMAALSSKLRMSRARARLINISGIVGTLYGLGTNVLFEIDSKRDFCGLLIIGSVLGLAAGSYFTRDYDDEKGYFADVGASFRPAHSNATPGQGEGIDISTAILPRADSGQERIPGAEFQILLVAIKF
jgi:hypothetical protein